LQPQLQHAQEMSDADLANRGIQPGSEAWQNAKNQLANQQNNLLAQVTTQGINTGLQANQQAYNQAVSNYNMPINTLNALNTGSQVQNPNFVTTPSGANYSAAAANQYGAAMGNFNAQQAAQGNLNSGLFGLGGAGLMAFA
jgi:hypothetical protein